jgi:hypothetical protein
VLGVPNTNVLEVEIKLLEGLMVLDEATVVVAVVMAVIREGCPDCIAEVFGDMYNWAIDADDEKLSTGFFGTLDMDNEGSC